MGIKKTIITIILIATALIGSYIIYLAQKRTSTAAESTPIIERPANELIKEFELNTDSISKKYLDKNIAVIGRIKEVDSINANVIMEAGESSTINCSFDSLSFASQKNNLIPGNIRNIKGIYFGYEGFDKSADEMELIPSEKSIKLKTCALNEK